MKKIIIYLMLFLGSNYLFAQNNLYVDGSGSCSGNTPCYNTIQAAVSAANSGDIIHVYPGTYDEYVQIRKPLTLESTGGKSATIIKYTTPGVYIAPIMIEADDGSYSNVTIGGSTGHGFTIIGADVTQDAAEGAMEAGAIIIGSNSSNTISNITISHNTITAGGDEALFTYYKVPGIFYSNINVSYNTFNGTTYVGTPSAIGMWDHGNAARPGIYFNPGTDNVHFTQNKVLLKTGEILGNGNLAGQNPVTIKALNSTITDNYFEPSFAGEFGSNCYILNVSGATTATISCNYFSLSNATNGFYINTGTGTSAYNVNTVASGNTFQNPGGDFF